MRVAAIVHQALVYNFVFSSKIDPSVFLGRRTAPCDENFKLVQSNGGGALIELAEVCII